MRSDAAIRACSTSKFTTSIPSRAICRSASLSEVPRRKSLSSVSLQFSVLIKTL